MKIGLFTATFLDMPLEEVFKMAAGLGYQAVEMPAFSNNPQLDIEEIVKGGNAAELKKMLKSYGLIISALANHPEGQIVLGPFGKDTDAICPGTKEEKIEFGTQRMIKTAQAANALEVPVVTGFIGCENIGRFFPWPYSKGWSDMEMEFVKRWAPLDAEGADVNGEPLKTQKKTRTAGRFTGRTALPGRGALRALLAAREPPAVKKTQHYEPGRPVVSSVRLEEWV